jgi:chromosome segregation ATPase
VALAVGLGAKTGFTQRGSRLDSLIKAGQEYVSFAWLRPKLSLIGHVQSYARITIELANSGADSFRYQDYGKTIVIQRDIRRGGGSTYKIKNHSGTVLVPYGKLLDN